MSGERPSTMGTYIKRGVAAGSLAVLCQIAYNTGNYNDSPGDFIDTSALKGLDPVHVFDAPIGDAHFLMNNFANVVKAVKAIKH